MQKWFLKVLGKIMVYLYKVNKLDLVFLKILQKMQCIKFAKILNLQIKI